MAYQGPGRQGRANDPAIAALRGEVSRLRRQLDEHERDHQAADELRARQAAERERTRRTTRRYWVTTLGTVVGSNLATVLVLVGRGKV